MARTLRARTLSQNVKAEPTMPQSHVLHEVLAASADAGIIGWQEVYYDRYCEAVSTLHKQGWDTYFAKPHGVNSGGAPISWKTKVWEFIDGGETLLCEGADQICYDRRITWVLLRNRLSKVVVAVTNRHYPANAWGLIPSKRRAKARSMWNSGNENDVELLEKFVVLGYPIIGFGDFNSTNRRKKAVGHDILGKPVAYHQPPNSIDVVFTIDGAGARWRQAFAQSIKRKFTDHAGRQVVLNLSVPTVQPDAVVAGRIPTRVGGKK